MVLILTVICPQCNCENDDANNFCENCGFKLHKICPNCRKGKMNYIHKKGFLSDKEFYQCDNCGTKFQMKNNRFKLVEINNPQLKNRYHDQFLTKSEWIRIFNGGVSNLEQKEIDKKALKAQEEEDLITFQNQLRSSSNPLSPIDNPPIICKRGEEVYLVLDNITLLEARAVRVSTGTYGGPTVRVSKNVSMRLGTSLNKSESHDELRQIDNGRLVISNKRLLYTGEKKNVDVNLNKIISITEYTDAIGLHRERKQKMEYFSGIDRNPISYEVDGRIHQCSLTGNLLKEFIIGRINELNE